MLKYMNGFASQDPTQRFGFTHHVDIAMLVMANLMERIRGKCDLYQFNAGPIEPIRPQPWNPEDYVFTLTPMKPGQMRLVPYISVDKRYIELMATTGPYINVGTIGHVDWGLKPHQRVVEHFFKELTPCRQRLLY